MKKKLSVGVLATCLLFGSLTPAQAFGDAQPMGVGDVKCTIFKAFCK